jgi:hypothetical protein
MSSAFSSGELRLPLPFTPALWHTLSCEIDGFTGLAPLPPLSSHWGPDQEELYGPLVG